MEFLSILACVTLPNINTYIYVKNVHSVKTNYNDGLIMLCTYLFIIFTSSTIIAPALIINGLYLSAILMHVILIIFYVSLSEYLKYRHKKKA